jgi:hypothetical protein
MADNITVSLGARGAADDRAYLKLRKIPSAAGIYPVSIDLNGQQLKSSFKVKPFNWIPVFDAEFNDVLDAQKFVWQNNHWKIGAPYEQPTVGMVGMTGPSNYSIVPWAAYVLPEQMTPPGPVTNGIVEFRVRNYYRYVAGGAEIYEWPCVLFRLTGVPSMQGWDCYNAYSAMLIENAFIIRHPNGTYAALIMAGFAPLTWYDFRITWQDGYSPAGVKSTILDIEMYQGGNWVSLGRFYDSTRWAYDSPTNMVAIGVMGEDVGLSELYCAGFDYFRVWRREPI